MVTMEMAALFLRPVAMTDARSTQARANQRAGERERLAVVAWYTRAGFQVLNLSQPGLPRGKRGHRGTFQTPGIPDLLVIVPGSDVFWHEVKSGKARVTPAQRRVIAALEAAGQRVIVGGVEVAKDELARRNLLVSDFGLDVLKPLKERPGHGG